MLPHPMLGQYSININFDFTYVSSKGRSVVDYCLVTTENFNYIVDFAVTTMSKCEAVLDADEEGLPIPDHSVLTWKVLAVDCVGSHRNHEPLPRKISETKYVVTEGTCRMRLLSSKISSMTGSWWPVTR